ncbi:hypothetical protein GQ44DRAFT_611868 [Phaeosphaeriaceae sp. PMI808]|nr:hypothetical protein GQ44DRAFT_770381 [Phaeosphaeriaceae sp. PMI808]KAH8727371.1 hypothetical protein GQ44DRAFT_611868 [Phaeosphaeriaceae sp. PMI808]
MLSQVFTVLALGAASLVAGAPMEARTADEQVTVSNTLFSRKDSNGNDNWDTVLGVAFDLATPSSSVRCSASNVEVPSIKYVCSDLAYSFEISGRPGYNQYAFTIYHNSDVTLSGETKVGCNGPIPSSCFQVRTSPATLTSITGA